MILKKKEIEDLLDLGIGKCSLFIFESISIFLVDCSFCVEVLQFFWQRMQSGPLTE